MSGSPVLIVPAAGLGSRLGGSVPKPLVPVAGIPMIDRVLSLYRNRITRAVIVVNPAHGERLRRHLDAGDYGFPVDCVEQPVPTGMFDAIVLAGSSIRASMPSSIWITWCDQVAIHALTIEGLSQRMQAVPAPAIAFPTARREQPYIHFERDASGRIVHVLHRREGDRMPEVGEGDIGLFALSPPTYDQLLPRYANGVEVGGATGERNFLPFIPWVAREHDVVTFPCTDLMEAIGVNTTEELARVEEYLARRSD